jgi:hypothetical protein
MVDILEVDIKTYCVVTDIELIVYSIDLLPERRRPRWRPWPTLEDPAAMKVAPATSGGMFNTENISKHFE